MKSLPLILLLLTLQACQDTSHLRIRSNNVTKDYQLLHLRGSDLLVQDWDAHRAATWRTLAVIPINTIDTLWQPDANLNRNVTLGAVGGALATYATLRFIPGIGFAGAAAVLIIGIPAMGLGALVAHALPSGEHIFLPNDLNLIPFLRDCQKYENYDDMPPILQEKILHIASGR